MLTILFNQTRPFTPSRRSVTGGGPSKRDQAEEKIRRMQQDRLRRDELDVLEMSAMLLHTR